MQGHKRKRTQQSEIAHIGFQAIGALALLLIAVVSVRAAWNVYGKFVEASAGQQIAQAQLASLQSQEQTINADLTQLNSPGGLEAEVRARYGVVKPGEGEIQIVENQSVAPTTTPGQESIWVRFWHLVAW